MMKRCDDFLMIVFFAHAIGYTQKRKYVTKVPRWDDFFDVVVSVACCHHGYVLHVI